MTIITYLGGKYTVSYHIIDLVGMATNIQKPICNEVACMLTLFN